MSCTGGWIPLVFLLAACGPADTTNECVDRDLDGVCAGEDCNDQDPNLSPEALEIWYDGIDQDCDGNDQDQDLDGHGVQQDCNDEEPRVHPGAEEIWYDGIDQDCDGYDDDQDQDGHGIGTDCDDLDAGLSPSSEEIWYDGIDQDCDGNDDDQDLDGSPLGEDCDDEDNTVYPTASEHWYDGIDQDCDGNDLDQDEDGFDHRSDCDDTDPTVNPDAFDVWYDGVDSDCGGNNDYDQDGDGFESQEHGGDDCTDDNPTLNPDAYEVLGDGIDRDCDGHSDTAPFVSLSVASSGLRGPRLAESNDGLILGILADSTASGDPGAIWWFFDETQPWTPWTDLSGWSLPGYQLADGYDLVADGDMVMEAAVLNDLPVRYVLALGTDLSTGTYGSYSVVGGIPNPDDLNAVYDGETVGIVSCTGADEFVLYLFGSMSDLFNGEGTYAYTDEGGGTACSPRLGADKVLVSDPDDGTYYGYRYNSESNGLAAIETGSANWYDLDHSYTDGEWAFGATSGTSLDVNRSGVETTISTVASMRTVQVSLRDQAVYIAAVDSSGDAWLVYGSPVSGVFTEVAMETGLTQPVLDVDVIASSADTLLFSARSATELAVMGVSLK